MRRSLLVSYDLRGSDETSSSYRELIKAIEAYGYYAKLMLSTWIVVTDHSCEQVRDNLLQHMDSNDRLIVGRFPKGASWRNLMASAEWMKDRPSA